MTLFNTADGRVLHNVAQSTAPPVGSSNRQKACRDEERLRELVTKLLAEPVARDTKYDANLNADRDGSVLLR